MPIDLRTAAATLLLSCHGASGQLPAELPGYLAYEAPGVLVPGDFDGDGCDDVLVLGASGPARTYRGARRHPFLAPDAPHPFGDIWSLWDVPVFAGQHLYLPVASRTPDRAEVQVYRPTPGGWRAHRVIGIAAAPGHRIGSLRLTALHRDVDGDRRNDTLAVWSELPMPQADGLRAAYLAPTGPVLHRRLPPVRGQPADPVVVDLHRAHPLPRPRTPEYLVTLGAPAADPRGGLGFLALGDGPAATGGRWLPGPALDHGRFLHLDSGVSHLATSRFPAARVPMVTLRGGAAVLFDPATGPPWVGAPAEVLFPGSRAAWLDGCVADFDGDGAEEAVLALSQGLSHLGVLWVGDPAAQRAYGQVLHLSPPTDPGSLSVFHGVVGDFDGDGDPDLLLCLTHRGRPRNGRLALFRADRQRGKGRPSLLRAY